MTANLKLITKLFSQYLIYVKNLGTDLTDLTLVYNISSEKSFNFAKNVRQQIDGFLFGF